MYAKKRRNTYLYRGVWIEPAGIFGPMGQVFGMVNDYKELEGKTRSMWWVVNLPQSGTKYAGTLAGAKRLVDESPADIKEDEPKRLLLFRGEKLVGVV